MYSQLAPIVAAKETLLLTESTKDEYFLCSLCATELFHTVSC